MELKYCDVCHAMKNHGCLKCHNKSLNLALDEWERALGKIVKYGSKYDIETIKDWSLNTLAAIKRIRSGKP